jgi:HK97 family phage portal protein
MFELVKRIFARRQTTPERQPEVRHVRMGNTTMGVNIYAPEEMLKISTVWRCVNLIANSIATLPWQVRRPDSEGNAKILHGHDVARLLTVSPNPEMTAFSFRTTLVQHKLLYGNAYAEIERDGRGRPVALWPIAPDRVDPMRDESGVFYYRVSQPTGGVAEMEQEDIFHVPGMAWDGLRGYSILEVAMQSLGTSYAMDRFAGRYFGRGMQPSGVIEIPEGVVLDEEGFKRLRDEFEQKHQGWASAQGPLILDQGMKWASSMNDPDKGQFLDTRKFSVFDAARWFGVPPYLAFASDEEPRANVEAQGREFLMYGLDPHIVSFEQEANRKLFTGFRPQLETRMNVDEFQRGDLKVRAEYYTALRHLGVMSVNDIRRAEGLEKLGKEGDVRVMQVQFQPIGPDGAPTAPKTGEVGDAGEALPGMDAAPAPPDAPTNGSGKTNGATA